MVSLGSDLLQIVEISVVRQVHARDRRLNFCLW